MYPVSYPGSFDIQSDSYYIVVLRKAVKISAKASAGMVFDIWCYQFYNHLELKCATFI